MAEYYASIDWVGGVVLAYGAGLSIGVIVYALRSVWRS